MGIIEGMILFNFALIIIPIVPVILIFNCKAIFRAFKSSIISVQFGVSRAKVSALDSP